MKYLKIPLILCFCLFVSSCDEDDILDFFEDPELDVTTTFVIPFEVMTDESSDPNLPVEFSRPGGLDILSNPDIAEEIGEPERIKQVVVNSITYEFINFSGNVDADVEGRIEVIVPGDNIIYTMPSVNAAESDLFGTIYSVSGGFGPLNNALLEDKGALFFYHGTATHNPVNFVLRVVVNATVTVELNLDDL